MPEKLEKLHLYLCVIAALIVTVISIVRHESLYRMSIWLSVTIIVFYGLGQIIRLFLTNRVFRSKEDTQNNDNAHNMDIHTDDPHRVSDFANEYDTDDITR